MHVLLLKEPRDGESGIDPYIEVDVLTQLLCNSVHSVLLNLGPNCDVTGAGSTRTHSSPRSRVSLCVCLIKHLVRQGKVEFTLLKNNV